MQGFNLWVNRAFKFYWQRLTRGWDDSETWDLNVTISKFILPRLLRLQEVGEGRPCDLTDDEWDLIVEDIIYFHEYTIRLFENHEYIEFDTDRYQRGQKLFCEYYNELGW